LRYSEDSQQAKKSLGPQNLASLSTLQRLNLEPPWRAKSHFLHTFCRMSITVFIWGVRRCSGRRLGTGGPLVRPGDQASSSHHSFWKCANIWLAGQGDVVGRAHLGSVEPVLCATSFPYVIFSMTMPYFGHNEDMPGFCSIWCFSIIRCS
jgi:hypothetical protein